MTPTTRGSYKTLFPPDHAGPLPVVDALDGRPAEPAAWTGWLWDCRRKVWERACRAAGLAEASRLLGEKALARGITSNMHTVLTRGAAPAAPPAAPPQKRGTR
jgi:hypothetical protein